MTTTRRRLLAATAAAPFAAPWIAGTARAEAKVLKISHQFPGGTIDSGDFRDQLCRRFAADLAKRTNGALTAEVYPNSSLVKTVAQTIHATFQRIQFTPDLLPADITGTIIYNMHTGEFTQKRGPLFANLVLADEVNRPRELRTCAR